VGISTAKQRDIQQKSTTTMPGALAEWRAVAGAVRIFFSSSLNKQKTAEVRVSVTRVSLFLITQIAYRDEIFFCLN